MMSDFGHLEDDKPQQPKRKIKTNALTFVQLGPAPVSTAHHTTLLTLQALVDPI